MKTVLILLVSASACFARLGETYNQCVARYGTQKDATKDSIIFEKGGIEIVADFELTKCITIEFHLTNGQAFTDAEIQKLLEANGGGSQWKPENPKPGFKEWKTKDGKSLAFYHIKEKRLLFISNSWLENKKQKEKEQRDKAIEGF